MKKMFHFSSLSIMAVPPLVTHIGFLVLGFLGHELLVPSRTVSWTQKISSVKNSFILPLPQTAQYLPTNTKNKTLYIASKKNGEKENSCYVFSQGVPYIKLPSNAIFLILPLAWLKSSPKIAHKLQTKGNEAWSLVPVKPREECPQERNQVIYGS